MCRHTVVTPLLCQGLHETARKPSCPRIAGSDKSTWFLRGEADAFGDTDAFSSPCGTPEPAAVPASPLRVPQQGQHPTPSQHEAAVQRCLFGGQAQKAFGALPRLIVPAAPFSSACYGSPMQLPTPTPASLLKAQRKLSTPQHDLQDDVQDWLASMELSMSGSRSSRACSSSSSGASTPAGGADVQETAGGGAGASLPPPAFALLGLLQ